MNDRTQLDYHERMLRVLVHIQNHLDDALDLADLAAVAHFSPYHFHRVFRGMIGEGVKEHVRRLRLERAAHRLKHGDTPVTRLAFQAGYETHEAFTRAFRAMFGDAPSAFRESRQSALTQAADHRIHYAPEGALTDFTPNSAGESAMQVTIEKLEPMRVAFMRHTGPYQEVGATWGKLCAMAGMRGLMGPQAAFVGLCHDDPEVTPPDKIRYDACLMVAEKVEASGELGVQTIAGGDYAKVTHQGPYEKLNETYAYVCGQWLPGAGREPRSAPSIEMYKNSPQDTAPEDLITDVYVPLA